MLAFRNKRDARHDHQIDEDDRNSNDSSVIIQKKSWLSSLQSGTNCKLGEPPPDGGFQAWLQVVLAHLTVWNSFGAINAFGIFQYVYTQTLHVSPSSVSWVGSMQILLVYFGGTFSGRMVDAGYFHLTIFCGFFLQIFGVFMTSISTQYWQLFLAQGLCQGLGNGLLFCPLVTLVTTYFGDKKRPLALACAACGGGSGGLVFPAIAQTLLSKVGLPWTVRIMGFVMLFNAVLVLSFSRVRVPPRGPGPLIEWSAFKDIPYVLFSFAVFLTLWGTFYAFYYVRPFSRDILGGSQYTSFSILLTINGVGIPGRIIFALISLWWLGPLNSFIPASFLGGILLFCWIPVDSLNGLFGFVGVFGLFGGAVQSLFPAAISSLTTDMKSIGVRIGMVFSLASPACLTGPPIAGALIQNDDGKYLNAQIFGGTVMILGSLFALAARIAKTGFKLKQRI